MTYDKYLNHNNGGAIHKTAKSARQKVEAQLLRLDEGTEYARAKM